MHRYVLCLLATLPTMASGCSAAPSDSEGPSTARAASPESAVATKNTVVAHVKLGASHTAEILENEDGIVLFTEAGSMDGDEPLFDAAAVHETSLVELYEKLQARALEPETSVVDLSRLRTLDEHTIAARLEKNVTTPVASEEELIEKATYEGNLGGPATQGDWDWWRGHCNPHTYVCEVGISGDRSFMKTNAYITSLHFNEHSTNQSTMLVMWDPCYNSSPFTFCTKPFKTLWNMAVAPRSWISAFSFNEDKYRWSVHAIGDLCGWSVTFDNPRTW